MKKEKVIFKEQAKDILDKYEKKINEIDTNIIEPYICKIKVCGNAPLLFHAWNVESVEEKSRAAKGSITKKTDDLESYVYRDKVTDNLLIPIEYFRQSCLQAAKFKQDPRSPRKSAQDIFKAGISTIEEFSEINGGVKTWDYVDARKVAIQRAGITRKRPAMNKGWFCEFEIQVLLPEYISSHFLNEVIQAAGKFIGVGDFRPTFGRFQVVGFEVL